MVWFLRQSYSPQHGSERYRRDASKLLIESQTLQARHAPPQYRAQ